MHAIEALAGLAHETRLEVFRMLVAAGPEGLPAGQIGERLDLPPATLSFHLNNLKHAGLIRCRRNGRSLIYAADFAQMNELVAYLTENCCGGAAEACGLTVCPPTPPPARTRGVSIHETPARARRR